MAHRRQRAKRDKIDKKVAAELFQPELFDDRDSDDVKESVAEMEVRGHYLVERQSFRDGRLVSFHIAYARLREDNLIEQYSIDTRHGYLHEHTHGHRRVNDRRDIRPLFSQVDVQDSYYDSYQLVVDRFHRSVGRV